jgi:hypothetical protein
MYPSNREVIMRPSSPLAALLAMAKNLSAWAVESPFPGRPGVHSIGRGRVQVA